MTNNSIGACSWGQQWKNEAYVALRVFIGVIFLFHGYQKIFISGIDAVTGFFSSVGIPMAQLIAPLVAYGEFLGGIALILGFLTHWVAKLNVIIMLGAIYFVHFSEGFADYEFQLLILIANIVIATTGAGMYSLDAKGALGDAPVA